MQSTTREILTKTKTVPIKIHNSSSSQIPKHIHSPLIQELPPGSPGLNGLKFGGGSNSSVGGNSGIHSIGSNNEEDYFANYSTGGGGGMNSGIGYNRPHTVAFDTTAVGMRKGKRQVPNNNDYNAAQHGALPGLKSPSRMY